MPSKKRTQTKATAADPVEPPPIVELPPAAEPAAEPQQPAPEPTPEPTPEPAKKQAKASAKAEAEAPSPPALRIGHLQRIKNLWRTFGSDPHYIRIRLQEEDGSEFTVLLTEADLADIRARADRNPEDVTKAPFLVDVTD